METPSGHGLEIEVAAADRTSFRRDFVSTNHYTFEGIRR